MKVSGFTIVRNAIRYDYPVVEAIQSILPLCDELVVALGRSEDDTETLIRSIDSPKIRIIHTLWDDSLRQGGKVLAVETDKAFDALSPDTDWAFYIQADEVLHENSYEALHQAMQRYQNDSKVEGLLLKYIHFYGNYNYVGDSRRWYRNEIRVLKYNKHIRSYRDAQGFRIDGRKLQVKPVEAYIHHYGWVKHPKLQKDKIKNFNRYWHSDEDIKKRISDEEQYDYSEAESLKVFTGSHPKVMQKRIQEKNWELKLDVNRKNFKKLKYRLLYYIEKYTGKRLFEYKNYKVI